MIHVVLIAKNFLTTVIEALEPERLDFLLVRPNLLSEDFIAALTRPVLRVLHADSTVGELTFSALARVEGYLFTG